MVSQGSPGLHNFASEFPEQCNVPRTTVRAHTRQGVTYPKDHARAEGTTWGLATGELPTDDRGGVRAGREWTVRGTARTNPRTGSKHYERRRGDAVPSCTQTDSAPAPLPRVDLPVGVTSCAIFGIRDMQPRLNVYPVVTKGYGLQPLLQPDGSTSCRTFVHVVSTLRIVRILRKRISCWNRSVNLLRSG